MLFYFYLKSQTFKNLKDNFLVLPTGDLLITDQSNVITIYSPTNRFYDPNWAPIITSFPSTVYVGSNHQISGIRFNGMTEGSYYGDDGELNINQK